MRIKNIIESAAKLLGMTDSGSNFDVLLQCANLVATNIASSYLELVAKQTFTVTNGRIRLTKFRRAFLRVKNISTRFYRLFTDRVEIPNGRVTVEYAYVPRFRTGNERNPFPTLGDDGLAYGIAAEYSFITGMFSEAQVWNRRLEELLFSARPKRATIPAQVWK